MGGTKAIIFWPETEQVSIEDLSLVNEDDRYLGCPTSIQLGNCFHKAVVKFISSDQLKLQTEEQRICDEVEEMIKKREAENLVGGRKTRQRRTVNHSGVASANQVASAFGERQKPTPEQALKNKKIAESRKTAVKAHLAAQAELDKQVLLSEDEMSESSATANVIPNLTKALSNKSSKPSGSKPFTKRSENSKTLTTRVQQSVDNLSSSIMPRQGRPGGPRPQVSQAAETQSASGSQPPGREAPESQIASGSHQPGRVASETRSSSDSQPTGKSCSGPRSSQKQTDGNLEMQDHSHIKELFVDDASDDAHDESESDNGVDFSDNDDEVHGNEDMSACCHHCLSLKKAYSKSGSLFVEALTVFGKVSSGSGTQYVELLPISADTKKCELTQKSNVFISIADKNEIKSDGEGDPSKMTRMCLLALYGRDCLEMNAVTAKGSKAGTVGIPSRVRKAIKAFVNRNKGKTYAALTDAQINRVINRKKNQVHRAPSKANKNAKTKKSSPKTPKTSTARQSPVKNSSLNVSPTKKSPRGNPMSMHQTSPMKEKCIASPSKRQWSVEFQSSVPVQEGVNSKEQHFQYPPNQSTSYFSPDWQGQGYSSYSQASMTYGSSQPQQQNWYNAQPQLIDM